MSSEIVTSIDITPAATEMLLKLWGKYTLIQTETNKHLEAFKEFERYLRSDRAVPDSFTLSPDGKVFLAPAVPEPAQFVPTATPTNTPSPTA